MRQQNAGLGKEVEKTAEKSKESFKGLGDQLDGLGRKIAAAFTVAAVVAFGKESLKAFAEAELAAKKLSTAVSVSGGLKAQFDTLINQSKKLQETTIFSDEQIQAAQTLALQFGLTNSEVKKLIPIITDFASATGQDLQSALESVLRGTEGMARGLKLYGIEVSDSATKSERLTSITKQLTEKFSGQGKEVGETTTGAFKKLGNTFNDLQESIGKILSKGGGFIDFLREAAEGLNTFLKSKDELKQERLEAALENARETVVKDLEDTKKIMLSQGRNVSDAFAILIDESNTIIAEEQKKANATWDLGEKQKALNAIKYEQERISTLKAIQSDEKKQAERDAKDAADAAAKAAADRLKAMQDEAQAQMTSREALAKSSFETEAKQFDVEASERSKNARETITDEKELQAALLQIEIDNTNKKLALAKELQKFGATDFGAQQEIDLQIQLNNLLGKRADLMKTGGEIHPNREDYDKWLKDSKEADEKWKNQRIENIQAVLNAISTISNDIQGLIDANFQSDIDNINARKEASGAAIDEELAKLEDKHKKNRIGDAAYDKEREKLLKKKQDQEKKEIGRAHV